MATIIELPEVLANQIAAGEVIERPASVVKELVENSIDAGSTQISISIEESGLKKIEISDNGEGIAPDQVSLALRRHATSKIKSQSDLFRIRTLGFRGEALPSIASVSRIRIETATEAASHGLVLEAEAGQVTGEEAMSRPVGTRIAVEDLFYNTPARLKYVKSQQAELSHIVDVVNRLSLAHPEIAFSLINEGRELIQTAGTGNLRQAISGVYGIASAKKMVEIAAEDLDFKVSGYVSLPELTRANRNYISIFINGRYIKNFLLNRAILDGYGSKLMVGRFPLAVIDIQIDPYLADVNVHPTKQEVRISKEKELMALIREAIAAALKEQDLIPDALENLAKSSTRTKVKTEQVTLPLKESNLYYDTVRQDFFVKPQTISEETKEFEAVKQIDEKMDTEVDKSVNIKFAQREEIVVDDVEHPSLGRKEVAKLADRLENEESSTFPELEYFGQMHGTYLFAQGKAGLYIIDQHAAQERVKYEEYRDSIGNVDSSSQQLLVPYIFDFPANDALLLKQKLEALCQVGVNLEEYGVHQFILREHPIWMKEDEIESAVYEMCDMLLLTDEVSIKRYRAELAIMMSCKRSIKANHSLDDYSARHLLSQLATCKNPYNCPHGRPVLVHFTTSDMEKMFRRIQENHTSLRELGKY
ncbi:MULTISPECIES: DNA mismatch repair endonuclease MutL [unclassified Streptococcus]|uniref:DNA mismatch repair endonuclease MutL n=1 Tax=unclassified Streptococcus TaxID=2608887 RepID=UPI0010724742|nr:MULTISPECIES: DNA mismatch repair endonuclease MutL [unclassified Streptococcus]MBF0787542.1 DNA mismatch repair endonuclease MutL [Streptococcus sp. 19428wC2_LYSM12]MCQ9211433.1 DNA mismatch repair endonuclease MutL [Streptococcus sp. B01]MCQ9214747.1 DNA mismatch repair endonuclease MutL [Streptococcus sp. O1]TFV05518.1 DNA mismatch repair endonuclease MutL [Streptococcus sp. LYSM12]